jgi:hypothetical protein
MPRRYLNARDAAWEAGSAHREVIRLKEENAELREQLEALRDADPAPAPKVDHGGFWDSIDQLRADSAAAFAANAAKVMKGEKS